MIPKDLHHPLSIVDESFPALSVFGTLSMSDFAWLVGWLVGWLMYGRRVGI